MDESPRADTSRPSKTRSRHGRNSKQNRPVPSQASEPQGFPPKWLTPLRPEYLANTLGDEVADFAEAIVPIAKDSIAGLSGEPLILRPWQRELLRHMLARKPDGSFVHRTYLAGIARKNGKTALISTLAIYFGLFGDRGGEIYSAAADRDQAKLVMAHAKLAVEMTPDLKDRIKVYRDVMEFTDTGTIYKALSSEAFTKEGLSATLVIADELAAWPNRDLFDVLSLSMGARRSPLMVGITTAGPKTDNTGADSIAYTLYQLARRRIAGENQDESLGMAWWEADEHVYKDQSLWYQANPGLLSSPPLLDFDDLVSAKARTPEGEFRTKRLNEWVSSATAFLPAGTWEACTDSNLLLSSEDEVVIGFDGSFSNDSTAIVACRVSDKSLFVLGHWERPIDADIHWRVPVEEVEARMEQICREYQVKEIVCDPFRWQRSMEMWAQAGLPVVEFPQSPARMVPATAAFYDAVVNNRLKHTGDGRLARHAANATPYTTRNGTMVKKASRESNKKIDLLVAGIMAHSRASTLSSSVLPKAQPKVEYIEL